MGCSHIGVGIHHYLLDLREIGFHGFAVMSGEHTVRAGVESYDLDTQSFQ